MYTGDKNDLLKSVAYANGATISYVYNDNGKPTQMSVNGSVAYTYTYDKDGILVSKNDIKENTVTTYVVNEDGSTTVTVKNSNTSAVTDCYTISKDSLQFTDTVGTHTYGKTGNSDETLDDFSYDSVSIYNKSYKKDSEDKVTSEEITDSEGKILSTSYTYDAAGNITLITNTTESGTEETAYTYDSFGNITTITINGVLSYHYYYDISDQLIRVDDAVQNETITYTYDGSGNILSVNTYDYTTDSIDKLTPSDTIVYKYDNSDFPDELTSYDGKNITYDELGNPLSYLGWNMTWEAGRRLSKINNGTDEISYKYDDNGIRTSKTVNGVTTTYTSIDGRITSQDDGTNTIYYRYDKDDELTGFNLNETEYVYVKNAQGDVTGILDTDGKQVVNYTYDAWGKAESITGTMADTVGQINPMRYRGYYQDEETGFYYLQSRYYDPVVKRFINADEPTLLTVLASSEAGANLFAYCGNNAVNRVDKDGYFGTPLQWVCAVIGGIAGWLFGDYVARKIGLYPGKWWKWKTYAYWAVRALVVAGGAILGYISAGALIAIIKGFIFSSPKLIASTHLWVYKFLGIATGSGSVVLGRYPTYLALANRLGSNIFSIATEIWNSMNSAAQWAANRAFLDKCIQMGQKFTLSNNAYKAPKGTYFYREIQYLLSKGYRIAENGWAMIKK